MKIRLQASGQCDAAPVVRGLELISTAELDIGDQSVELVAQVPLELPEEVTTAGDGEVTVIVTFTEALGSRNYEVGMALTGAQSGLTYQLAEPSVDVVLTGPVAQLDELAVEDISVEIPVSELVVGDNEVMPIIRTPRGTEVVRVTPETVSVTVATSP